MTIINGKIPLVNLTALSVGGFLQANAAYWFEQWRIAARNAGYDLTITSIADAYREYAVQERIFRQRYTPVYTQYATGKVDRRLWLNSYWYRKPGYAAAAVPGTSNHGRGLAVDIKDVGGFTSKFYKWLKATGADYGFSNTEGASVNEAWHWVHNGKAIPPKPAPPKPAPEQAPTTPQEYAEMFIISNDIPGHAQRGTAWVAIPQGGGKPRATTLFGGDKFTGAPVITFTNLGAWNNFANSIAWA